MIDLASLVETRFGTWLAVFKLLSRNIPLQSYAKSLNCSWRPRPQPTTVSGGSKPQCRCVQVRLAAESTIARWGPSAMGCHEPPAQPQAQFRNTATVRNVGEM